MSPTVPEETTEMGYMSDDTDEEGLHPHLVLRPFALLLISISKHA